MSIGARDWVVGSTVDAAIFERWPDYQVTFVAADRVDVTALAAVAAHLHAQAHDAARTSAPGEPDAHTARWHQAYRDFRIKPRVARPSIDALVRRAASDNGLPRINVLVDLYNAISILHRVPIGGEDLDRYQGPARLALAGGSEPFHATADGEPTIDHPDPGEPVWLDDEGVTCRRWNWRQTTRTAIHPGTVAVGFIIDSLDAPDHRGAALAAAQLAGLLTDPILRTVDAVPR
ncbi:MAG TPA: phenylalanine--tRNA ligase beta subunit-related protein [Ilumatobacter sp.]|nr:phenylalanine--tRNA ligase beta subunit-related protein [Ilumatobacter sp.]